MSFQISPPTHLVLSRFPSRIPTVTLADVTRRGCLSRSTLDQPMSHLSDTSPPESSYDEPTPKLSRLLWWLQPKVALPLVLFAIILFSPLIFRAHRINSVPDIAEPFDLNAFGTVDIDPADNAMTQYKAAVGLYLNAGLTGIPASEAEKAFEISWEQTSEPLRKWLAANEPALAEWRKGTELKQSVLVQPKDMKIDMRLDVIENLRSMSRLALLKADQCLSEGDVESAWSWHRSALRFSQHVSQNGVLIQRLIGISFFQQAAKGITRWADDPRVTAVQLQTALEDIRAADKLATPNSDALKCEYLVLRELLGRDRLDELVSSPPSMSPPLFRTKAFLLGDPEYSQRLLRHFFDNWLSECDKPRWQQAPLAPGHLGLFEHPAGTHASLPPRDINARFMSPCFAREFLPALGQVNAAFQRAAARESVLKLALACQIYYRLRGDWPVRLDDLKPEILLDLPADPLGRSGETFLMKRDGDELIIYSVGWNGADDGGQVGVLSSDGTWLDEGFRLRLPTKSPRPMNSETAPQEKH